MYGEIVGWDVMLSSVWKVVVAANVLGSQSSGLLTRSAMTAIFVVLVNMDYITKQRPQNLLHRHQYLEISSII